MFETLRRCTGWCEALTAPCAPQTGKIPICSLASGKECRICQIENDHPMLQHLGSLGFTEDSVVRVVNNTSDPVLLRIGGCDIAISREALDGVTVVAA